MAAATSSPMVSPSSDKRFWSTLRSRVETLLESRNSNIPTSVPSMDDDGTNRANRLKEDSMLLIRGFDSVAYSLSQLTGTLDIALQEARDLAKPPTLTEIVQKSTSNTEKQEGGNQPEQSSDKRDENTRDMKGVKKRKLDGDAHRCSDSDQNQRKQIHHLNKVKNLAVSMATKSASLARELKSVKSDLYFMQERCTLLDEENRRLRDGFGKSIRPDEDDLVRLQLEALLAEKSRLATENANLTRENQCLRQLVEYHQFASQDLSASYEQVIQGLCLDFSSPEAEDPETPPRTTGSGVELYASPLDEEFAGEQED